MGPHRGPPPESYIDISNGVLAMPEKLNAYDILAILVPGILLCAWITICFPATATLLTTQFPDAFSFIAITALAVFLGQIIQAIAALLEPVLYWTCGGRPSDRALEVGLKACFPKESVQRIQSKLTEAAGDKCIGHSLFLYAMQQAEGAVNPRIGQFNSLYAYHRALLVLAILAGGILAAAMMWGAAAAWTTSPKAVAGILLVLLIVLIWHRAWQRACYYVREVLLTAERALDDRKTLKE